MKHPIREDIWGRGSQGKEVWWGKQKNIFVCGEMAYFES